MMKHVKMISRVDVRPAQMSPTDIITLLVSVLSALGTLVGVLVPAFEDKAKQ